MLVLAAALTERDDNRECESTPSLSSFGKVIGFASSPLGDTVARRECVAIYASSLVV